MHRRSLLALAAGTLVPSVAGCLDGASTPGDSDDDPSGGTDDGEGDDGSDGDGSGGGSPSDGSSDDSEWTVDEPEGSYPDYGDRVQRIVAYDEVDPDEVGTFLEPATRRVAPAESISFALENHRDVRLATNFYGWRLDKLVDGEWFRVAPQGHPDPLTYVEPGESHSWTVQLQPDGVGDGRTVPRSEGTSDLRVSGVGGGRYAFAASGWFDGETYREQTAFVATVDFDADSLPLAPTAAIRDVEWEGETLVAYSDRQDADGDGTRLGAYELERLDGAPAESRRVITEQVVRDEQLRDALALARKHDADRVRLEEYDTTTPIFGVLEEQVYEYDGVHYRIGARELEE